MLINKLIFYTRLGSEKQAINSIADNILNIYEN